MVVSRGKGLLHGQFKRRRPRWDRGVAYPLIDVGVDLQRYWRKFSPDPVHVHDWGEPPCRASPSGLPEPREPI